MYGDGVRYKVNNAQYRIQNTEYRIQNTKYRIQSTKYKIQLYSQMSDITVRVNQDVYSSINM